MGEEERRRCCILGGCGCTSGSAEQRAAMKEWLLEILHAPDMPGAFYGPGDQPEKHVDGWLDKLFADNPALTQKLGSDE